MPSDEAPSAAMLTVFSERRSDLLVTAREMRAEGVVSLTLADPAGAQLPGLDPGRPHRPAAGRTPSASTRCAGPRRPAPLADRGAARPGRPRRVPPGARDAPGRRPGRRPRPAQPLPAALGAALHLPGRRHRHHPDPAHGRGRDRGGRRLAAVLRRPQPGVHGLPGRTGALRRAGDRLAAGQPGTCCRWTRSSENPADGTLVYCCGPEGLLAAAEQRCAAWPAGSLHLERFAAKPQPEPAAARPGRPRSRWSASVPG